MAGLPDSSARSFYRILRPYLNKETIGSPEFPGYPRKYMTWSQTPVVTLSTFHDVFRSAAFQKIHPVGFHFQYSRSLSNDHNYTFFGAQYKPCILDPPGFGLPSQGLPSGFTTTLLDKL
jgi:hypothetical protein